jgi:hypothetical protein
LLVAIERVPQQRPICWQENIVIHQIDRHSHPRIGVR